MAEKVHPVFDDHTLPNAPPPSAPPISRSSSTANSHVIKMAEENALKSQQEQSLLEKPTDVVYKVPEPLPRNHPSYRTRRRRCSPCCCCLGWICGILGAIIAILGITALVLYLVLQPKAPKFSVTDARVSVFNLTSASSSSSATDAVAYINTDVTFTVQAENPNKKIGIYYDAVDVTLYYDGTEIGTGSVSPFYQGHRNTTELEVGMKGQELPLGESTATVLKAAIGNTSSGIWLQAKAKTEIRVKVGHWKSGDSKFEVNCDVEISNPASGNARLLSKSCKLKLKSFKL